MKKYQKILVGTALLLAVTVTSAFAYSLGNGVFVGLRANALWGYVQVQATIAGGKITRIQVLEYPNHTNRSNSISNYALPTLARQAMDSNSSSVDVISGATLTSEAFAKSLTSALKKAAQ
ncbi:MAG: FMN-binding protein [Spirochaetales bacterium]